MSNWRGLAGLAVLWCVLLIFAGTRGGFSAWFLLFGFSVLSAHGLCLQAFALRRVAVIRRLSDRRVVSGDDIRVSMVVRQRSYLPLAWLIIEDEWFHTGKQQSFYHRKLFIPWFRAAFNYEYTISHVQRGKYKFTGTRLITGDLVGFVLKRKRIQAEEPFVVFPRPLTITRFSAPRESFAGEETTRSRLLENAAQVSSVRDYVPGDGMNRIHWKSTSRTNALKTKEMEAAGTNHMVVFLDAAHPSNGSKQADELFEACVQTTASLLKYGDEHQYHLGLFSNTSERCMMRLSKPFKLSAGYEFLAGAAQDGETLFHEMLWNEASSLSAGTLIICVAARMDERFLQVVEQLRFRKMKVKVVYLYDSTSLSWHDRQLKQQLEALGCDVHELHSSQVKWQGKGGIEHAEA